MNFSNITLLVLIVALIHLAIAESSTRRKTKRNLRYKLFKSRLSNRLPEEVRQYRQDSTSKNRPKGEKNNKKGDDYEDIGNELANLDLDDPNRRIFFFNKGATTTTKASPIPTTTTTTETTPSAPTAPTTTATYTSPTTTATSTAPTASSTLTANASPTASATPTTPA